MEYNQKFKDDIINELTNRIKSKEVELKCPICTHEDFVLSDGFTRRDLAKNNKNIQLGGLHIPSISIICSNCGYILDFSIGALGYLNKTEDKEVKEGDKSKN